MSMTVGQLRKALVNLPDDQLVVLAKDSEGNDFSPLEDFTPEQRYAAQETWYGVVYDPQEDDAVPTDAVSCLVLWPVN